MLTQSKCQIYAHNDSQIIGVCQNVQLKQHSKKVCLYCLQQSDMDYSKFNIQDIMTEDTLNKIIEEFKEEKYERNNKALKQCRINKCLQLMEIQNFIKSWYEKYTSWLYLENLLSQINNKHQNITIQSYLDDEQNKYNLRQFLERLDYEDQNEIDQILKEQPNIKLQQKIKNQNYEPIDSFNEILDKLTKQVQDDIKMDHYEMLQFMIESSNNNQQIYTIYEKFYNQFPDHNDTYQQIIKNIIKKMEFKDAEHILKQDDYDQVKICNKGLILKDLRNANESLNYFNKLIYLFPKDQLAYLQKGLIKNNIANILKNQYNYEEAIDCLDQCIERNPNFQDAYIKKAKLLKKLKNQYNYEEAIDCLDQCIERNPNFQDAYIKKAKLLKKERNQKEAIQCLDQYIQLNPKFEMVYLKKANMLVDQNAKEEAIECLNQCINNNPNFEDAYMEKAYILIDQQNYREALECLEQCIQISPNFENAYKQKVFIFENIDDNDNNKEMIECLDQWIRVNKNSKLAFWKKAIMLQNGEEALYCLDRCIQVFPNNDDYYPIIEDIYMKKGSILNIVADLLENQMKYKEAIQCFDQCIQIKPNFEIAYLQKVKILENQKNYKEAIDCLDQLIQAQPYNIQYMLQQGNKLTIAANLLENSKNYKEVIEFLDQCIKSHRLEDSFYVKKANILQNQRLYNEAIQCLEKCCYYDNDVDDDDFHYHSPRASISNALEEIKKNQQEFMAQQ